MSEKPDKCLAERRINPLEQLYGTLSAKDSLLLQLGGDVQRFTARLFVLSSGELGAQPDPNSTR